MNDNSDRSEVFREAADKAFNASILLASILLGVHLLDIKPTEIEALGMKIAPPDASIIRGIIAIIFLHFLYVCAINYRYQVAFRSNNVMNRQLARHALKRNRNKNRDVRTSVAHAKAELIIWNIIISPYISLILILIAAGIILSLYDFYRFAEFCYTHTAAAKFVRDALFT